jgi:hypothetical protein
VKCVVPSFSVVNNSDPLNPIPPDNKVVIEISNNGIDFSNSGVTFEFIDSDQFK